METTIRILFAGEGAPDSTASICVRHLIDLGHEVLELNEPPPFPVRRGRSFVTDWALAIAQKLRTRRLSRALVDSATREPTAGPHIFITIKGRYFSSPRLQELQARTGAVLLNWQTDDHFSPTLSSSTAIEAAPSYDCIFVHSKHNLEQLLSAGARRVEYLPHGADPDLYKPFVERTSYARDVLFIGSWRSERARFLEELVKTKPDFQLEIRGAGWERRSQESALRPYITSGQVPWEEMGEVLRSSRIVLSFNTYFDTGHVVAPLRIFEVPVAGAFLLTERGPGLAAEFYVEDQEVGAFADADELRENITFYLNHPNERNAIAKAGQERALRDGYLYSNRAERMIEVGSEIRAAKYANIQE